MPDYYRLSPEGVAGGATMAVESAPALPFVEPELAELMVLIAREADEEASAENDDAAPADGDDAESRLILDP